MSKYGWTPDTPDIRDHAFKVSKPIPLPPSIDLTPDCTPVYDQGQLGSCTANAIGAAIQFCRRKQQLPHFAPSRLFLYYNERAMEGTIASDAGAMIRDGIKCVARFGDCPEAEWPYDEAAFAQKPRPECYSVATHYQALQYQRIPQEINQIKQCLAEGFPFVFGFTVYDSFETPFVAATGKMPMPEKFDTAVGGHAVMAVGYDDESQLLRVRNSWGDQWGQAGYFVMPYEYILNPNLADDLWSVRLIEVPA